MVKRLRLTSMVAWSETTVSHRSGDEKSSVSTMSAIPGFWSGVGALSSKTSGVGVSDGGNQTMVAVGEGVADMGRGSGVKGSNIPAQPVRLLPRIKIMRICNRKMRGRWVILAES